MLPGGGLWWRYQHWQMRRAVHQIEAAFATLQPAMQRVAAELEKLMPALKRINEQSSDDAP